jgi:hypothetical protein
VPPKSIIKQPQIASGMEILSAFSSFSTPLPHSTLAEYQLDLPIN